MSSRDACSYNYEHDFSLPLVADTPAQSHHPSTSQGHSSPFLPGYLLGDQHSLYHSVIGPSKMNFHHEQRGMSFSGLASKTPSGQELMRKEWTIKKGGGPPVKGLYSDSTAHDNLHTRTSNLGYSRTHSLPSSLRKIASSSSGQQTTGLFQNLGGSQGNLNLDMMNYNKTLQVSQAQSNTVCSTEDLNSENVLDETWVTVFGKIGSLNSVTFVRFPPVAIVFILQQFSQYGTILTHRIVPDCNWMHICYSSKIQARRALSNNGKVYARCLKIGVTPCTEMAVIGRRKCQSLDKLATYSPGVGCSSDTHIRPLTAAYLSSRMDYEVLKGKRTPKRDTSIFSKLKEYMFGY